MREGISPRRRAGKQTGTCGKDMGWKTVCMRSPICSAQHISGYSQRKPIHRLSALALWPRSWSVPASTTGSQDHDFLPCHSMPIGFLSAFPVIGPRLPSKNGAYSVFYVRTPRNSPSSSPSGPFLQASGVFDSAPRSMGSAPVLQVS